jgi:anionic cell wall polymer biosynthesis LytR-Cps2A-Psr (LCP) family protein
MVSIPRDMVSVPLGNGDDYGPKINSLLGYVERNPEQFAKGPMRTLQDAIGALLGIPDPLLRADRLRGLHQHGGLRRWVDVKVKKDIDDPTYDGYGINKRGWSITKGRHRLDGVQRPRPTPDP